ncbi:MAG: RNA polymerase sigma factor [Actinomycetota bacterium]
MNEEVLPAKGSSSNGVLPPFWLLAEEHTPELLRYARRLAGDEAEDVVQEALLRALRSYPRVRDTSHLRAWLYRIVMTTAFDHSAKRKKTPVPVERIPEGAVDDRLPDDGFAELIGELPDGMRRTMVLRFVEDLAFDDIAARLNCSPQAARQRVSSAVRALRGRS